MCVEFAGRIIKTSIQNKNAHKASQRVTKEDFPLTYAAAYIRVSTEDQTEYSPDAQLRAIKSYCQKNDYYLDPKYVFTDEGKSGRKAEKRPAFMKMIGTAKQKPSPFQVILCHKFDRFARNREDSVVYKSLLNKECGVKVVSITETIENDKMSLIMESMLEAMAEYYSINLGEEVKKGMTEKARRGEPLTIAPFGYRMKNKCLIKDEKEAPRVAEIFEEFIAGKPYLQIAKECNAQGYKTHRGGRFENRTVDYIINNPVYMGYIRWTPGKRIRRDFSNPTTMVVKGSHEPIVSEAVFDAAQKRVKEIKALYLRYYKPQYRPSHWLVGLLRAPCGSAMINSGGYFVCSASIHGACEERNGIAVPKLEALVLRRVRYDLQNLQGIDIVSLPEDQKRQELQDKISDLEMRLSRAKDAYERGVDSLDEYAVNKRRLLLEIDAARREATPKNTAELSKKISANMTALLENTESRAEIAHAFIKKIVWDKKAQTATISYYAKV